MKKKILGFVMACFAVITLVGCSNGSGSRSEEEKYQNNLMDKAQETVGMPDITNFTERKMAKMIFELRDNADLVTYSYIKNVNGKYTYLGQSIGYGLPYSVQYTAPEVAEYYSSGGTVTVPQSDPNGLYMPEGLNSTWIMLTDEVSGEVTPMYVEDNLTVSQFKLPRRLCDESTLPENY